MNIQHIRTHSYLSGLCGILFTLLFAGVGNLLANSGIPGFTQVGAMATALLLAIMYRQLFGYPAAIRKGIEFSAKRLLRVAIILFGFKLNIQLVLRQGWQLLLLDALVITFAILFSVWLARRLKSDPDLSLLLAVGTGVCGAAAIASVAPILDATEEDTATSVGIIAMIGTLFALGFSFIEPFLPMSVTEYGIWTGASLHEIAHVAMAGSSAGAAGLTVALLAKLGRVLLLVPLCFVLLLWKQRQQPTARKGLRSITFPWFLLGFIFTSLLGSLILEGPTIPWVPHAISFLDHAASFLLIMAMVGLGLNVDFRKLRGRVLRPLAVLLTTSILLALLNYGAVRLMF